MSLQSPKPLTSFHRAAADSRPTHILRRELWALVQATVQALRISHVNPQSHVIISRMKGVEVFFDAELQGELQSLQQEEPRD
jgi:hypothetical protein